MADIFPRLNIQLNTAAGVLAPAAARSIEAIKQDVIAQLSRIPIGTPIKADVIAQLDDGSFIANVANVPLRLILPTQAKIGDKLNLTLLQTSPRLTFSLDGKPATAIFESTTQPAFETGAQTTPQIEKHIPVLSSGTSQTGPRLHNATEPQLETRIGPHNTAEAKLTNHGKFQDAVQSYQAIAASAESSAQIELSPTGKILATVFGETSRPGLRLAIKGTAPLTDDITATANPSRLAQRIETQLNKQIEHSGLFYESHLVQWAEGKRDIVELKSEPQSTLSLAIENTVLTDTHEANHVALTQLVHQQLDVLDQGRFAWVGNLTESVSLQMQIEVEEEDAHSRSNEAEGDNKKVWRTKLNLHFPKLGEIELAITHRQNSSDVQCKVESPEIMHTLHEHAKELITAFDNSGNQLHSMKVSSK